MCCLLSINTPVSHIFCMQVVHERDPDHLYLICNTHWSIQCVLICPQQSQTPVWDGFAKKYDTKPEPFLNVKLKVFSRNRTLWVWEQRKGHLEKLGWTHCWFWFHGIYITPSWAEMQLHTPRWHRGKHRRHSSHMKAKLQSSCSLLLGSGNISKHLWTKASNEARNRSVLFETGVHFT